ncbi:MAG: hypothetical protein NC918_05440 [Candidatus Omnitrophica bacterium]|nr:hypothetical protein [Candidatus Omnitrophota bacterium]
MLLGEKNKINLKGIVKYAYKKMGKAIADYNMLSSNDKLLVAVSGGVDSLCLLKLLLIRKERVPINFEMIVCFVDTDFIKIDKDALFAYLDKSKVKYVIKNLAFGKTKIDCFWCSWNRRKIIFETAKEYSCNKVVLGHNMDDIVETILLNLFFNGEISAMKPKIELFGGKLTIIRPLCYIEKKDIINLATKLNISIMQYECLYGKNSKRQKVKDIIGLLHSISPTVKKNIFRAIYRIRKDYLL